MPRREEGHMVIFAAEDGTAGSEFYTFRYVLNKVNSNQEVITSLS